MFCGKYALLFPLPQFSCLSSYCFPCGSRFPPKLSQYATRDVLMAININIEVYSDVTPCTLVSRHRTTRLHAEMYVHTLMWQIRSLTLPKQNKTELHFCISFFRQKHELNKTIYRRQQSLQEFNLHSTNVCRCLPQTLKLSIVPVITPSLLF